MPNQFMPEKEVLKLKQEYPPGTRGTVDHVDDAGQVHPIWDNGRTLAIVPEVDSFRKLTEQELKEEQQLAHQNQGEQQWQTM